MRMRLPLCALILVAAPIHAQQRQFPIALSIEPTYEWIRMTNYAPKGVERGGPPELGRKGFSPSGGTRFGGDIQVAYQHSQLTDILLSVSSSSARLWYIQFPSFSSFNEVGYKDFSSRRVLAGVRRYNRDFDSNRRVFGEALLGMEWIDADTFLLYDPNPARAKTNGLCGRVGIGAQYRLHPVVRLDIALHGAYSSFGSWQLDGVKSPAHSVDMWSLGARFGIRYAR